MQTNDFNALIDAIRTHLGQGEIEPARAKLDLAWAVAGQIKPLRTIAHAMGNEIQGAIFEQYLASDANQEL